MNRIKYYLKSITDHGLLLRVRLIIFHCILILVNLDIYIKMFFKRKNLQLQPKASRSYVGIFSMYRPIFWHGNIFEMQMNKAVENKGQHPVHILCRGFLDVCDVHYHKLNKKTHPEICKDCRLRNDLFYVQNKAKTIHLDEYYKENEVKDVLNNIDDIKTISEAEKFQLDAMPLGRLVKLSVCRYWLRLHLLPQHLDVYKDFLKSAVKLHNAFSHLEDKVSFENFLIFNGRYSTHGIPLQKIKQKKKPFHTYEFSEQERILYTKNDISVMWNDVLPRFKKWQASAENNASLENDVVEFMTKRKQKFVAGYVDLNENFDEREYDIAIFTNIVWDSGAFERETIFDSQYDWIEETIKWLFKNPNIKAVLRIHPAETNVTYNKSMELMEEYIRSKFTELPKNLELIPAQERKNSYSLIRNSKLICVYTSSIGLESALENKPVLGAASTHYMLPGITITADNKAEYFNQISEILRDDSKYKPDISLVHQYVYWFYKVYHRLNNVDLYKKAFNDFVDSKSFRVPKVKPLSVKNEFSDMTEEFLDVQ